ncbi:diacylglycerol kinase family protein [Emcibacter sp.]|uniref:diacylglycerol/lipid kinase family protein n=1 Tax=Emcibacter sp. TaxID=1979954 RepID=UPI002AA6B73D|nr:diacylglycerol kinase family protein [Emcibacter sp.]
MSVPDQPDSRRRITVIHNPVSGRRNRKKFNRVLNNLHRAGCDLTLLKTEHAGHATDLARTAVLDSPDVIVAAGGDGTLNEVLNGLYGSSAPLAFLPLGTVNVFAREIGLGTSADAISHNILAGKKRKIVPGCCNGRYFLLMVSCGLDSHVVHRVNLGLKKMIGGAAYGVRFLQYMFSYPDLDCTVTIDGRDYETSSVIVSRGKLYGGSLVLVPHADLFEPAFQVVMLQKKGLRALLSYGWSLLRRRLWLRRDVTTLETRSLKIRSKTPYPLQMDGDPAGRLPADIHIAEQPVTCIIPEKTPT